MIAGAQAVHDEEFQLDGDVLAGTETNIGANAPQTVDWDSLFDSTEPTIAAAGGFEAARFDKDFSNTGTTFVTSDESTSRPAARTRCRSRAGSATVTPT